jgi:hypothetical protein
MLSESVTFLTKLIIVCFFFCHHSKEEEDHLTVDVSEQNMSGVAPHQIAVNSMGLHSFL